MQSPLLQQWPISKGCSNDLRKPVSQHEQVFVASVRFRQPSQQVQRYLFQRAEGGNKFNRLIRLCVSEVPNRTNGHSFRCIVISSDIPCPTNRPRSNKKIAMHQDVLMRAVTPRELANHVAKLQGRGPDKRCLARFALRSPPVRHPP
jgi:hypothetical protein